METTKFKSQFSSTLEQIWAHLEEVESALSRSRKSAAGTFERLRQESQSYLRALRAGLGVAISFATRGIATFGARISDTATQLAIRVDRAHNAILAFERGIVEKPRRRREARLAKENDVLNLLAGSPDAVVVTDADRRLIAANTNALHMFGISEHNLRNFTIDAFLVQYVSRDLGTTPSTSMRQAEQRARCKIRRLDGGLRVADCRFAADILPDRNLYKFLDVAPYKITPFGVPEAISGTAASRMSTPSATKPAKKIPRHGVRPVY